jgi:hypothetical protein
MIASRRRCVSAPPTHRHHMRPSTGLKPSPHSSGHDLIQYSTPVAGYNGVVLWSEADVQIHSLDATSGGSYWGPDTASGTFIRACGVARWRWVARWLGVARWWLAWWLGVAWRWLGMAWRSLGLLLARRCFYRLASRLRSASRLLPATGLLPGTLRICRSRLLSAQKGARI